MEAAYAIFERIVWLTAFFLSRFLGSFKAVGRENMKGLRRPVLIIANHRSFLDPMLIGTLFPFFSSYIPMAFMVDDGFYNNILLRPFFVLTKTFPANRGKGLDVSLKEPRRVLKNGGVFLIFPSGQRHISGPAPRPKIGAAVLAMEYPEASILPIYLEVSGRWTLKDIILRRKKITAVVGKPFLLKEASLSPDAEKVAEAISEKIFRLKPQAS